MDYGKRLTELRLARDLKQTDLAELIGASRSAIGSYERCERQPTFELLKKYSDFFNVSIDYILCNSDSKQTVEQYKSFTTLDLQEMLFSHSVTLDGVELTEPEKQRALDIIRVLLFDRR